MLTRRSLAAGAVLLGLVAGGEACAQTADLNAVEEAALAVVARRTDAFNAHDVDAFLAAHAEDVTIIGYPDVALGHGRAHLERIFGPLFDRELGSAEVHGQWVRGGFVVSNETVIEDGEPQHIVFIYHVEDDEIASMRLIANPQEGVAGETEQAALAAVARRIDGFNAHDLDAYVAAHAEDVGIYVYPDRRLASERDHLARVFGPQLAGSIDVREQWAVGPVVASDEQLTDGGVTEHIIGIYTVDNGLISEVRLIEEESE